MHALVLVPSLWSGYDENGLTAVIPLPRRRQSHDERPPSVARSERKLSKEEREGRLILCSSSLRGRKIQHQSIAWEAMMLTTTLPACPVR